MRGRHFGDNCSDTDNYENETQLNHRRVHTPDVNAIIVSALAQEVEKNSVDESDGIQDPNCHYRHQSSAPFSFFAKGMSSTSSSEEENRVGKEFHELSKMLISTTISLPRPRSDSNVTKQKVKAFDKVTFDDFSNEMKHLT